MRTRDLDPTLPIPDIKTKKYSDMELAIMEGGHDVSDMNEISIVDLYEQLSEARYAGNIGFMEVAMFYKDVKEKDVRLASYVSQLIKDGKNKLAWDIIQDYLDIELIGSEFGSKKSEPVE